MHWSLAASGDGRATAMRSRAAAGVRRTEQRDLRRTLHRMEEEEEERM